MSARGAGRRGSPATTLLVNLDGEHASPPSTGVPADLLEQSRRRVILVAIFILLAAGLDLTVMVVNLALGSGDEPPGSPVPLLGNVGSVLLAAVLLGAARWRRVSTSRVLSLTLGVEVLLCGILSVTNPLAMYEDTGTLPILTWVTPVIILVPLLVPTSLRRTLIASVAAAATRPLGILLLHEVGIIEATPDAYGSAIFGPTLAVILAAFSSRVVVGLGREVAAARRLGSYHLQRRLGHGGMGEVWLGRHRHLARPAAIKLIRPERLGDADLDRARRRFEREAEATAALRSPHTIGLYDFGVSDQGAFYYVMEYLDGFDAEELVRRFGPLSAARTVHLLLQVCESLSEAHEAGLIHRDVKPANLFVCRYGRAVDFVKVLDFGLVEATVPGWGIAGETSGRAIAGTPAYMAPEQVTGEGPPDPRSDLYALGAVGVWLLTGTPPFPGRTAVEVMAHHLRTVPEAPSSRTEVAVPAALDRILLDCLAKDPGLRPATADELATRLRAASVEAGRWTEEEAHRWWARHAPRTGHEDPVQGGRS